MKNAIKTIAVLILLPLIAYVFFSSLLARASNPSFETEEQHTENGVMTDLKTGCQYMVASGSITPRMHADGTQVCLKTGGV